MNAKTYNTKSLADTLLRVERLKVLRDLNFESGKGDTLFDRFTTLASQVVGAPVSIVSMVSANHQFFKSYVGLPEPWATKRQTPLSHSFCKHVVATNQPLVVDDAREVDFLKDNKAIPDLNVIGYLGMPLTLSDGNSLGSFCVIDSEPRQWTQIEIDIVQELAAIITRDIDLRASARLDSVQRTALQSYEIRLNQLLDKIDPQQSKGDFLAQLRSLRTELNI